MSKTPIYFAPGQQAQAPLLQAASAPSVFYHTDHSDSVRYFFGFVAFCLVLFVFWMVFGTSIENQNYGFCVSDLCRDINWAKTQAELNRSVPAPLPPFVVPPPQAPQQVIVQQQPAPQTTVIQAQQPRVEYVQPQCGNCAGLGPRPFAQPYFQPQQRMVYVQPMQQVPGCANPYVGGNASCQPVRRGHPGIAGFAGGILGGIMHGLIRR